MKYCVNILPLLVSFGASFSPTSLNQRRLQTNAGGGFALPTSTYSRVTIVLYDAKIGIFFGSSTGNTEHVAELIAEGFGSDADGPIEVDEIAGKVADAFAMYDALVVGTPTWNTGADTERSGTGWDEIYYGEMQDLNLAGKKVAVFGLGDQISYSENYADASGELHDVFEKLGCQMMGYTSQDGYEHDASKAIRGDKFCGLLCDEINQDELTEERVTNWIAQLKEEGILDGGSSTVAAPEKQVDNAIEAEVVTPTAAASVSTNDQSDIIAELEAENARLRQMLDQSKQMDVILNSEIMEGGYTPHYNPKTCVTMWTSADGRKCYYTKETRMNP